MKEIHFFCDNRHAIPEFFDKFPILNQEFFKESMGSYHRFSLEARHLLRDVSLGLA